MNSTGLYNFPIYKGLTLRRTFIWKPAGVLANLSGYQAECQIRLLKVLDSTPALVTLNVGNGGVIIVPSAGSIQIYMSPSATAALTQPIYYYRLNLIPPNGDILPFLEGKINASASSIP